MSNKGKHWKIKDTSKYTGANGFKKGHKTFVTPEMYKKFGEKKRGKNHFFFGKNRTQEEKDKIRKTLTGFKHTDIAKNNMSKSKKGKTPFWINNKGSNSYLWKGGISYFPYPTDWTKTLRISIRERDKYICKICGEKQGDYAFDVHHIDYNKKNCDPQNLVALCRKCHMRTNHNRDYWLNYFKILIYEK